MDETELEIELACWIERHPEAGASMIDVMGFRGKRGTLALELGNLTWKFNVPDGYANRVKRIPEHQKWGADPYFDGFTFTVSIMKKGWQEKNRDVEDMFQSLDVSGLRYGNADAVCSEAALLNNIIKSQELPSVNSGQYPVQNHEGWAGRLENSTVVVNRRAKSLSDVLDFAYRLTTLYENHRMQTADTVDDELDMPLDIDETSLWDRIAELVNEARQVCKPVAVQQSRQPGQMEEEKMRKVVKSFKSFDLKSRSNSPSLSPSTCASSSESWVTHFQQLEVDSGSEEVNSRQKAKADSDISDSEKYFSSDGESSESDWLIVSEEEDARLDVSSKKTFTGAEKKKFTYTEMKKKFTGTERGTEKKKFTGTEKKKFTGTHKDVLTEKDVLCASPGKRKAQQQATQSQREPSLKRATPPTFSLPDDSTCLQFCNIEFNPASRSVECFIELSKFIKPEVARALGLNLNHPLRVEIVPIPVQLGAWSWYGDVEVYASQGSDYHYHIPEEEICGLLCLLPTMVQSYFHNNVSYFYNNFPARRISNRASEVNIFTSIMAAIVKRLTCMSEGKFCCVCGKREWSYSRRQVWSCMGNLCQATYETWRSVTTSDVQRQAEKASKTEEVKQKLRNHFTFFYQGELQIVLDAYGMETAGMSYEEMIGALAKIETWTEGDTPPCRGLAWGLMNPEPGVGFTRV